MPLIHDRIELNIENHVAHVVLSRADKMNALDLEMLEAIPIAGRRISAEPSVRAVVLSGDGGNFCAGLDKANFAAIMENKSMLLDPENPQLVLSDRTHGLSNALQHVVWIWRRLSVPVFVAIDGVAFGGGLQIALGGDCRYATARSQFSIMEMKWGLIPDMGSTQIMRHLVRDDVIRELTYTAKIFGAEQAKEWGFITDIVDDPVAHALSLAHQVVNNNPNAVRAAKRVIEASNYQSVAEGLLMESHEQDQLIGHPNQIEAVMSQFQKRKPEYQD